MSVEIERKFRLHQEPDWLDDCRSTRIEQGCLAIEVGDGRRCGFSAATGRRS